jgi:hypothetical protein
MDSSNAVSSIMDSAPLSDISVKRKRWDQLEGDALNEVHSSKLSRIVLQVLGHEASKDVHLSDQHTPVFPFLPSYPKNPCEGSKVIASSSPMQCENVAPSLARSSRSAQSNLATILEDAVIVGSGSDHRDGVDSTMPAYYTPWEEEAAASFHASLLASELYGKSSPAATSTRPVPPALAFKASSWPTCANQPSSSTPSSFPSRASSSVPSLHAILTSATKISPLAAANQLAFAHSSVSTRAS